MNTTREDMRDVIADIVNQDQNPMAAHRGQGFSDEVGPSARTQCENMRLTVESPRCEGHSSPARRLSQQG